MDNFCEAEDNFLVFRSQWLDYVNLRRDVTHADFRVAYFIASKINAEDRCMWWGVRTIASELGVSIATVTAATDRLSNEGLLIVTTRAKGAYRYSMRMPLDPDGAAFRAEVSANGKRRKKTGGRGSRVSTNETRRVSTNETEYNKA